MNVFEYTAVNNPKGASEMVQVYNLRPERNPRMLARQMAYCVQRDGNYAKKLLAKIHPDSDLFQDQLNDLKTGLEKSISEKQSKIDELFSNMNGQSIKADVERMMNADGTPKRDKSELLMIGGLMLIGLALVLKR